MIDEVRGMRDPRDKGRPVRMRGNESQLSIEHHNDVLWNDR